MKQLHSRFCPTAMAAAVILAALISRNACAEPAAPPGEQVTLHLEVDKERVYAGESVQVTVSLAADGIKLRNVAYPRLPPVNGRKLSFTQLSGQAEINDTSARYRFSAAFTPQTPGELRIGPAELSLELLQPAGGAAAFFGGVEPQPVTTTSSTVSIKVTPLPGSGRPTSFSGAVGTFKLILEPLPATVSAGTPLTIKSRIAGDGNLTGADCPALRAAGSRSYPPHRLQQTGTLLCEQVVMPETAGPLPALEWSYFDPQQQRYKTLSASLPTVAVLESRASAKAAVPTQPVQAVPRAAAEAKINRPLAMGAGMLLLTGGTALLLYQRRKLTPVATPPAKQPADISSQLMELEKAHQSANVGKVYNLLHRILQQIVAAQTGLPHQVICGHEASLMRDEADLQKIAYLFMRCNRVRYGNYAPSPREVQGDITLLKETVSSLKL